jgi:hypothetical protein
MCISGFVPVGKSSQVVLGVPFLRAWHSQYSYDPATQKAHIGLATPVATASGTTPANSAGSVLSFAGRKLAQGFDQVHITFISPTLPDLG